MLAALVAGVAVVVPAGGSAATTAESARRVVLMTDGLQFLPRRMTIRTGGRVVWRNVGRVSHTVTTRRSEASRAGDARVPRGARAWNSGFVPGGKSYARSFRVPGTYRYFCIPHEGARMVGTIVVGK